MLMLRFMELASGEFYIAYLSREYGPTVVHGVDGAPWALFPIGPKSETLNCRLGVALGRTSSGSAELVLGERPIAYNGCFQRQHAQYYNEEQVSLKTKKNIMKTAIVTGAASGLGRAIALRYAQKGWQVVCSDLRGGAPAGESLSTVDAIKKLNVGRAAFVRADVSKEEDVKNLVSSAVSLFGRLDVMVNNAGIALESHNNLGPKLGADTAFSTFNQTMAVNLGGVFLGSKYAIQQFLKQDLLPGNHRGWIVNTASVYGLKPEIGHGEST